MLFLGCTLSQVWYIAEDEEAFLRVMSERYGGLDTALRIMAKRLRPDLTPQQLKDAGVRMLFQPPGCTVVILPGTVFHWTVSLGFRYSGRMMVLTVIHL